jgi:hypothetical protein
VLDAEGRLRFRMKGAARLPDVLAALQGATPGS